MKLTTFIHDDHSSPTTISEIKRIHGQVSTTDFIGMYAYATQSGAASFDLEVGANFWENTPSKWLFGIDYGRTQPHALRRMCEKKNVEVRIVDGSWMVDQKGFIPRRDFHAKVAILLNPKVNSFGMVVGSGNFSSNGLRRSIEAGASVFIDNDSEFRTILKPTVELATALWQDATPAANILDAYERRWSDSFSKRAKQNPADESVNYEFRDIFWIEAGYVTKNRGLNKPGNQIDFPRGVTARYFGFNPSNDLPPNSQIGPVMFETPIGERIQNNLRLGNNMMEKISLPIPETHGFDIYDGKVLVFQRSSSCFIMRALEADDFEIAFGHQLDDVRAMGSGRRYGFIL